MGYIYCITNLINSKRYVGKTTSTIEDRWKEHCQDSKKERCEKRPLYSAFNKYGIENFKIEELEYIDDDNLLSDRETYWIKELETYGRNGYNATKGGDGKLLYDHNEILELYNLGYSTTQIRKKIGCDNSVILKVLKAHGIKSRGISKMIEQYDLAGNYIQTFDSSNAAKEWLFEQGITTNKGANKVITDCCTGRRNSTMYGYKWAHKQVPK